MKASQVQARYEVKDASIINASSADVWNVLKEFGTVSEWAPGVTNSYYLSSQTEGVGTGRHCDIKGLGSIQEIITDWQEDAGFSYSVTPLGPLDKSTSSWRLIRISDDQTRLEITLSYNLRFGLFGKILHKLVMRNKLEQSLKTTIEATKEQVESGAGTPELNLAAAA
jgi:hypothetical protein